LHFIINAYCKNRPGNRYVENGDYQVIHARDSSVIGPASFNTVEAGMRLEMSIILRQSTTSQVNRGRCPRCSRLNSLATATGGWIDWKVVSTFRASPLLKLSYSWGCPALFSIVQVDEDHEDGTGMDNKSVISEDHGGDGIAEEENQKQDNIEQITSPAS
jgi:hypothetical protein